MTGDGEVRALLEPCEGHLTGVTIYLSEGGGVVGESVADWSIADDEDAAGEQQTGASIGLPILEEMQAYEVRAWADHPEEPWPNMTQERLMEIEFTPSQVRELSTGTVRWNSPSSSDTLEGTEGEFRTDACATHSRSAD